MMGNVSLDRIIDDRPITFLQIQVFALCVLALMLDGMDSQTLAVLGPDIAKEWSLSPQSLGLVFTASSVTAAIFGSIAGGTLADRFGRRRLIIIATVFYGMTTAATAGAHTLGQLLIWRGLSGIGFGAVLPNATALLAEYWPARHRGKIICIAFGGFALGAGLGSALAAYIVPIGGWRSVLMIGGIVPILFAIALCFWLPESVRFMALDVERNASRIRSIMARLAPELEGVGVQSEDKNRRGSLGALFSDNMGPVTGLLWLISATSLTHLVFTIFWTPFIIHSIGLGFQTVAWTSVSMLMGGCFGPIALGLMMGRSNHFALTALAGVGSALSLVGFTLVLRDPQRMAVFAFAVGFCVQGFQSGFVGISADIYPTVIRATGLGWASGIGRLASIAAPIAGGYLVSTGLTARAVYLSSIILPAISLTGILLLWVLVRRNVRTRSFGPGRVGDAR